MKKKLLLKKKKDYKRIYREGISVADKYLVLFCLDNELSFCRFGFSIGKKVGKAVKRNKLKRRLKEICRENIQWFKNGYDYIFIARKGVEKRNFQELKESVENLAYRINKKTSRKN